MATKRANKGGHITYTSGFNYFSKYFETNDCLLKAVEIGFDWSTNKLGTMKYLFNSSNFIMTRLMVFWPFSRHSGSECDSHTFNDFMHRAC